jgi:hypothetical protein
MCQIFVFLCRLSQMQCLIVVTCDGYNPQYRRRLRDRELRDREVL